MEMLGSKMIQLDLKTLFSIELERPDLPADPACCAVLMHVDIGLANQSGANEFTFQVITPGFLIKNPEVRWGRGYLLMSAFSWSEVERMLDTLLKRISASSDSWEQATAQLCQHMEWEFENYKER